MSLSLRFEVTGLAPLLAQLHEISDPKALEKTTRASLGRSVVKIIAPRLAENPGWRYGGHGGRYPTKGLLGERRKISARKVRTRQGEMVAISVKPRGWAGTVEAWVVKGTKPHVISASGRGPYGRQAPGSVVRSINREESGGSYLGQLRRSGRHGTTELTRAGKALFINGFYRERVHHPGAKGRGYIGEAVNDPAIPRLVSEQLGKDIVAAMDRAARRRK